MHGKNIVICCDGTSNQFEGSATNVRKLSRIVERDHPDRQLVFYDPGVGTFAPEGAFGLVQKRLYLLGGLAFGLGFKINLAEAYRCLMNNYQPGDRIFLFGFSRGAYTVRALAGMIHQFGLLYPHLDNLVPYVTRLYCGANFRAGDEIKDSWVRFKEVPIHFLGVWDTVSSLGFAYSRRSLPYTANNPGVQAVRHAIAVDERRAYFRQNRWRARPAQDVKELWFPGVHCDVGGGYAEAESGLSNVTLKWMVDEARTFGLDVEDAKYTNVVLGAGDEYTPPDHLGRRHRSLRGWWWWLEFVPKNGTLDRFRFSLPLGKRRAIKTSAALHPSVLDRAAATRYSPPNLESRLDPVSAGSQKENRESGIFDAITNLIIAAVAVWLLGPLVLDLGELIGSGILWTYRSGVLAVVFPLVVMWAGANWIDTRARLYVLTRDDRRRLPHLRPKPYDVEWLGGLFKSIGNRGLAVYRKALKLDNGLAVLYGAALVAGFLQVRRISSLELPLWLLAIPVGTVLFDLIENNRLRDLIRTYVNEHGELSSRSARVASLATRGKFILFAASMLLLIVPLMWEYLAWPSRLFN